MASKWQAILSDTDIGTYKKCANVSLVEFNAHLIEDRAEFCPDKAVDEQVDGGVDHKEYVREKPGDDDCGQ